MMENYLSRSIFYVYMLGYDEYTPFYVGKGCKGRKDEHIKEARAGMDGTKHRVINDFLARGKRICIKILKDALSENDAFAYEYLLIKQYAPTRLLTNIMHNKYGFDYRKHQSLMVTVPDLLNYEDLGEAEYEIIWDELDASVKQAAREGVRITKNLYLPRLTAEKKQERTRLEYFAATYGLSEKEAEQTAQALSQQKRAQEQAEEAAQEQAREKIARAKMEKEWERENARKEREAAEKATRASQEKKKEMKRKRRERRRMRKQKQEEQTASRVTSSDDQKQ
jgi:hypothetical protein